MTVRAVLAKRTPPGQHYFGAQFPGDCAGGLIAALIALPYGLAMASLMGLPPVLGIFTSILTSIFTSILTAPIIALLGRNPVLIGGTASATVPFIALAVRQHGVAGAARISVLASLISGCCIWACPRSPPAGGDPKELLAAFPSAFALALISSVNILITSRVVEGCTT